MYRLQTVQSTHKIDCVSYAADKLFVARSGKGFVVLLPRYGKWYLGGRDDGAGKIDLGIYYAVRSIRMAKNAFRVEKFPSDLPTVD